MPQFATVTSKGNTAMIPDIGEVEIAYLQMRNKTDGDLRRYTPEHRFFKIAVPPNTKHPFEFRGNDLVLL